MAADCRASSDEFLDTPGWAERQEEDYDDPDNIVCWYCGGWGHRARRCSSRLSREELDAIFEHDLEIETAVQPAPQKLMTLTEDHEEELVEVDDHEEGLLDDIPQNLVYRET